MRFDPLFTEKVNSFNTRVVHWRSQVDSIRHNPPVVLEELQVAAEELRAADEEMRQQNRELADIQILLETERADYRDFFETAAVPSFVTDRRGVISEANRAAAQALGISAEHLSGRSLLNYIHQDDVTSVKRNITSLLETFAPAKCAVRLVPRGEAEMPVLLTMAAETMRSGHREIAVGLRWMAIDQREYQKLQREIAWMQMQFDGERKTLLESAETDRARRNQAEEAVRNKDRFIAAACHELRNAVAPTHLLLESLLADSGIKSESRDMLLILQRNISAEQRLITDLLDVSRLQHNKLELRREVVSLTNLLGEVVIGASNEIRGKQLQLRMHQYAGDLKLNADPMRLRQVFGNILQNAIKFTPAGGTISLRTSLSQEKHEAIIEIQDTGVGLRPADIDGIFQPFFQTGGKGGGGGGAGGLGLGLTIAQSLTAAHGGSIVAKSDGVGKGANFSIHLPLISDEILPLMDGRAAPGSQKPPPEVPGQFVRP